MTALTTSPFLTFPPGMASLTVATMTSPMPAYRRPEPPSTRMQRISLAPVLSATRSRDSCWIIAYSCRPAGSRPQLGRAWPHVVAVMHTSRRVSLASAPAARGQLGWCCLLGLLEDLDQTPPLGGRQRPRLHDEDQVTDARRALLVVRLDLARPPDDLA